MESIIVLVADWISLKDLTIRHCGRSKGADGQKVDKMGQNAIWGSGVLLEIPHEQENEPASAEPVIEKHEQEHDPAAAEPPLKKQRTRVARHHIPWFLSLADRLHVHGWKKKDVFMNCQRWCPEIFCDVHADTVNRCAPAPGPHRNSK